VIVRNRGLLALLVAEAVSRTVVLLFVPAWKRAAVPGKSGGVLAGVKFLLRGPFTGPLASVSVLLNGLVQMLVATLPVLAFQR
jgi:hypothetical protein